MKIVLVGGGTGGHFYPLIAVAEALNVSEKKPDLYYIGPVPYDKDALTANNITFVRSPAGKIRRYASISNIFDVVKTFFGFFIALCKLYLIYPDVVFSKGGYTSVPVVLAARILMIPVVIHDSDAVPGRATKFAMGFARYIGIAYDDAAQFFPKKKTALVGIPIRQSILAINQNARESLGIPNDKPLLFITGGSSGAERLNNLIVLSLQDLLPHYRVFHQVGEANVEETKNAVQNLLQNSPLLENYYVKGNVTPETMSLLLDAASLIITRAGSTTLFEIAQHGKPAIVVPIPETISHDQRTNAYSYARSGAALVMEEENLSTHLLAQEISSIINNPAKYTQMSASAKANALPGAAEKIAGILLTIGIEHGS